MIKEWKRLWQKGVFKAYTKDDVKEWSENPNTIEKYKEKYKELWESKLKEVVNKMMDKVMNENTRD